MWKMKRFPPEEREWAVRLVFDQVNEYGSQWACIAADGPKFDRAAQTLRSCVKRAEIDQGPVNGVSPLERGRVKVTFPPIQCHLLGEIS